MKYYKNIKSGFLQNARLLEALIIFLALLAVSFSLDNKGYSWMCRHHPVMGTLLVLTSLILVFLRIRLERNNAINKFLNPDNLEDRMKLLSNRQKEVLGLIRRGKTNKEIAQELFIEISTLKTHINHIYKSLGVRQRKEIMRLDDPGRRAKSGESKQYPG